MTLEEVELLDELCFFAFLAWDLWCLTTLVDELLDDTLCDCDAILLQADSDKPANSVAQIKPNFFMIVSHSITYTELMFDTSYCLSFFEWVRY